MDLIDAVKTNNLESVRMLVEQGADKDQGDDFDRTPLVWASCYGHLQVVQYFVEHGATLDKAAHDGMTPIITAAACGRLEVCRYLLEQGADRDKANNNGYTSLHWAAQRGHLEIAMLLMSYGADLNARNIHRKLPIDLAHNEEIKQAIRDEPRRRMDEAPGKRATEEDRHPNAVTSPSAQEEVDGLEEVGQQSNKRPRLNKEGTVAEEEENKVAEEDEDSEPSSDEADD